MQDTFMHYDDAGHGWIACDYTTLVELGVEDKISSCSYMRRFSDAYNGVWLCVFLEEDSDAGVMINAYTEQVGKRPTIKNKWDGNRSRIRDYPLYNAEYARRNFGQGA